MLFSNAGNTSISVWGSTHSSLRVSGSSTTDQHETDKDCGGLGICAAAVTTPGPFNPAQWDKIVGATPGAVTFKGTWNAQAPPPSGPIATDGTVYLYGPGGLPVEQLDGSNHPLFYHHDQLGSTRAVTDATAHTVEVIAYDTYGNEAYHSGSVTVPFGFGGSYTDPASHLVLIGHDYYDPPTGQFLTRIRRAITVGQNAPVLLRSGNPAVLSVELFFDTYEKQALTGGCGWGSPAGIDVELFFDGYEQRVVQFGDSWGHCRGNQAAYSSFVAVPDRVMRRLGTSPYALGSGDPVNDSIHFKQEFGPVQATKRN